MTYKNIKQFLRWSFWILIACLAICFFYAISGIWGILYLLALLIFSGLIIFAGWAFAYGIDVKYGDWDSYWNEQAQKKKKKKQK